MQTGSWRSCCGQVRNRRWRPLDTQNGRRCSSQVRVSQAATAAAAASPTATIPPVSSRLAATSFFPVPHKFVLGLRSITAAEWLQRDHNLALDLAYKAELLDSALEKIHVVGEDAASIPAQQELLSLIRSNLNQYHAVDVFPMSTIDEPAIAAAGRCVQEDLMIVERRGATLTEWTLTAGCVCFPSRWRLADKLGRSLVDVHGPVPGLNERLQGPITEFFDRLKPGKLVTRMNSAMQIFTNFPDFFMGKMVSHVME